MVHPGQTEILRRRFFIAVLSILPILMDPSHSFAGPPGRPGPGQQAPEPDAYGLGLQQKAASQQEADLQELRTALLDKKALLRLNTPDQYARLLPAQLAVQPILARLAKNPAGAARETIAALCASKEFLAEEARVECLLEVLPAVRPLPAAALPLLKKSLAPDNSSQEVAVRVLFEIGSAETLALFAAELLHPRQDPELLHGWMRDPLLRHRRDPAVLQMCLDLFLNPKFEQELKNALVEVLFDYRPDEWYGGQLPAPKPPSKTPAAARGLLKQIAAAIAADPAISVKNKALAAKG